MKILKTKKLSPEKDRFSGDFPLSIFNSSFFKILFQTILNRERTFIRSTFHSIDFHPVSIVIKPMQTRRSFFKRSFRWIGFSWFFVFISLFSVEAVRIEVFVPLCDGTQLACGKGKAGNVCSLEGNLYWGAAYHNLTHKYLDLKINLSELLQILCETYAPP
ncbi:hypothetical protein LEP1GSC103_1272 [Leptospira borgpetersenii serovar Javanica str. UI 09931]|uniref:Uncharacterized protein n=5 Tax=Leptospira borgpetersenii TaxID=174 RepID=M3HV99_LEPBO|nr:hypothetical protein C4Q31_12950 [Leptospira borgpetersenii serovar Ceylonica]EKP15152.1 hypothetical protein LEP1GSC128_2366 [Leptospira borgpetersenii str. 200801926]EKQ90243.1 hypothetical protein LEP1GSC101_2160 [Leptospira borgpetersenii str. UI 09149]EMG01966.1 hypothetical protein LEP1GSC123_0197 [Leptospira borgpetersenii str. 200701203]EMN13682.1 hypothetical protein LEP1GSC055_3243 [Leptospira borgpetersenii str. Brem 307]EMN15413.1 hypothetical protein LEP1GSC056_3479 [Leptospira